MSKLVPPHGSPELKPLLLEGQQREEELKRAKGLKLVPMSSRETSDLIMMGIGAFTPLDGFMGQADWRGCCETYSMPSRNGLFWPIPITLSADEEHAGTIAIGEEVALWDLETEAIMGTMKVTEKYVHRQGVRVQAGLPHGGPGASRRPESARAGGGESGRPGQGAVGILLPGDVQRHL